MLQLLGQCGESDSGEPVCEEGWALFEKGAAIGNISSVVKALARRFERLSGDAAAEEATILVAHVLGVPAWRLPSLGDHRFPTEAWSTLELLVARREAGEPVAYITGETMFLGLAIHVSPDTFIPRRRTELWLEEFIEILRSIPGNSVWVADIGTGSGCIAVAMAVNDERVHAHATDISPRALQIAKQNATRHGVLHRVHLYHGDLAHPLIVAGMERRFQVVACNPPCLRDLVADQSAGAVVEPGEALACDRPDLLETLVSQAARLLCEGGWLAVETDPVVEDDLIRYLAKYGFGHSFTVPRGDLFANAVFATLGK